MSICIKPGTGWICTACQGAGRKHEVVGVVGPGPLQCTNCGHHACHGTNCSLPGCTGETGELFQEVFANEP